MNEKFKFVPLISTFDNIVSYSRLCTVYWYAQSILTLSMGSVLSQEFGDFSKCNMILMVSLLESKIPWCSEFFNVYWQ